MLNDFLAGPDLVWWKLSALGPHGNGPFRLTIHHSSGSLVEYFQDVTSALLRQGELELILLAARATAQGEPSWSVIDRDSKRRH